MWYNIQKVFCGTLSTRTASPQEAFFSPSPSDQERRQAQIVPRSRVNPLILLLFVPRYAILCPFLRTFTRFHTLKRNTETRFSRFSVKLCPFYALFSLAWTTPGLGKTPTPSPILANPLPDQIRNTTPPNFRLGKQHTQPHPQT